MKLSQHLFPIAAYLACASIALLIFRDFGMGWDEGIQSRYGELALRYFQSGMEDMRSLTYQNMALYSPHFEMTASFIYELFPDQWIYIRHLVIALYGLIAIPALIYLSRSLTTDAWLAVFVMVVMLMLPRYIGHLFNNSKDVPLAASMTVLVTLAATYCLPDRQTINRALLVGLGVGLVAGVRPAGLPIAMTIVGFGSFGLLISAFFRTKNATPALMLPVVTRLALHGVLILAVGWTFMVAAWPWAHQAPIANPLHSMMVATDFPDVSSLFYRGTFIRNDQLPWFFLNHFILITTPILVLAFFAVGASKLLFHLRDPTDRLFPVYCLLTAWTLVPLILFMVLKPVTGTGLHHFLFVLPSIAFIAGYGAHFISGLLTIRLPSLAINALILGLLCIPLKDLISLHPYQIAYYNQLVGGLKQAGHSYESDYLVSGYREAIGFVNVQALQSEKEQINVLITANQLSFPAASTFANAKLNLLPIMDPLQGLTLPENIDYYVSSYRYGLDDVFPKAPVLYEVGREGIRFVVVKGR